MPAKYLFDFDGNCPICGHVYLSKECPHSYQYVQDVMEAAQNGKGQFLEDVRAAIENMRSQLDEGK